jgi:hypothetical protein
MKTCKQCSAPIPRTVRINGEVKNLGSRKYCLSCSPFGQHNTRRLDDRVIVGEKICCQCKEMLPMTAYYRRLNRGGLTSECKDCTKARMRQRQKTNKDTLVAEAGGRCVDCGYSKSTNALVFHHTDPDQKTFGIANHLSYNIDELRREAAKCILLCCRCHAERHDSDLGT